MPSLAFKHCWIQNPGGAGTTVVQRFFAGLAGGGLFGSHAAPRRGKSTKNGAPVNIELLKCETLPFLGTIKVKYRRIGEPHSGLQGGPVLTGVTDPGQDADARSPGSDHFTMLEFLYK
jgi:hypothetical protein